MASTMVIKVKYGDTLRRFNAQVNENDQLDLDIVGLKAKVLSLFSLNPDADITLTYIDEDGDIVTLVDDDDLRDVMRQQLRFLRIDVQLKNEKSGRSNARSSGSSTPSRSPLEQPPFPNMNYVANEVLKPIPEPIRAALLKLSHDSASKVASTSPTVANLVDSLSRIGLSFVNPDSLSQIAGETGTQSTALASPQVRSAAAGSKPSKSSPKANQDVPKSNSVDAGGNDTGSAGTSTTPVRPPVDLNKPPVECDSSEPTYVKSIPVAVSAGDERKEKKRVDRDVKGKAVGSGGSASSSVPKHVKTGPFLIPDGCNSPYNECPFSGIPLPPVAFRPCHTVKRNHAEAMGGIFHRGIRCDGCGVHPITGPRFKSKVKEDYDLCNICFLEMGNEADYLRIDRPMSFKHPWSFKGTSERHSWPTQTLPLPHILRNPYGSKSARPKLDSRFILDVNIVDGTLMAPSTPFTKIWRMRNNGGLVWPRGSELVWIGGDRFSGTVTAEMEMPAEGVPVDGELDIAVDFTSPEHPGRYISYWRMASPSGQKFGQRVWVLIQVDVSISNTFSANIPVVEHPPISIGTKGPQATDVNVNTDIECDSHKPYATPEVEKPINEQQRKNEELNFPIDETLLVGQGVSSSPIVEAVPPVSYPIIDFDKDYSNLLFSEPLPAVAEPATFPASSPLVSVKPSFPAPVLAPATFPAPAPATFPAPAPATFPAPVLAPATFPAPAPATFPAPSPLVYVKPSSPAPVSAPAIAPVLGPTTFPAPSPLVNAAPSAPANEVLLAPAANVASSSEATSSKKVFEEALLKELEEMGFKQVDLNKEILRMNEYNLEQSVDDLCGVAEWDPLLEELEEMGFCDTETNKKLLAKNNGSIKRVVMDLVNGEKDERN